MFHTAIAERTRARRANRRTSAFWRYRTLPRA